MFGKKGSKILKLPPVRNCFTLAMTNKLVVIINSLKVPKIKKILPYEMKFLVPNYSCLQNPWLEGLPPPRSPFSLPSVLNWICWTPPPLPNKIPGYATDVVHALPHFACRHRRRRATVPFRFLVNQTFVSLFASNSITENISWFRRLTSEVWYSFPITAPCR